MSLWTRFCDFPFRMPLPFVPQTLSVLAFTNVSQMNQSCFSLLDNKDVIISYAWISAPPVAVRTESLTACFVVFECSSAAARSLRCRDESAS